MKSKIELVYELYPQIITDDGCISYSKMADLLRIIEQNDFYTIEKIGLQYFKEDLKWIIGNNYDCFIKRAIRKERLEKLEKLNKLYGK